MSVVLDASAVLAVIKGEPGAEKVEAVLVGARLSAVNYAEVAAKLVEDGTPEQEVAPVVNRLLVRVIPFDAAQALAAGLLRRATRVAGLSLGDRACLALARREGLPALTADRAWAGLDLGITVEAIR